MYTITSHLSHLLDLFLFHFSSSSVIFFSVVFNLLCVLVTQSCLILCNPMDCSPLGSSVHGILQTRILECVAIPFSRGSSQPRDQTHVSCIADRFFYSLSLQLDPSNLVTSYIVIFIVNVLICYYYFIFHLQFPSFLMKFPFC